MLAALLAVASFQPQLQAVGRGTPCLCATAAPGRDRLTAWATLAPGQIVNTDEDGLAATESYASQFERLFGQPLRPTKAVAKPSSEAQRLEPSARRIPFSDVYGTLRTPTWRTIDWGRLSYFVIVHCAAAAAVFRMFTWRRLAFAYFWHVASGLGITYSFHRQLSHRSFSSPKWLEYIGAYLGTLAAQGSPLSWVSDHRYHHLHTDTALDPHSTYEGFWWSHMGWVLETDQHARRCPMTNVDDLKAQPFYRHLHKWLVWHLSGHLLMWFSLGFAWTGRPAVGVALVCWRLAAVVSMYHCTWLVNSAAHCWGSRDYRTGDQSRNNWWVGFLAYGEGWHNNHHAFPYSARHGLGRRQFDLTWMLVSTLERCGLVTDVKLPTEAAKRGLAIAPGAAS